MARHSIVEKISVELQQPVASERQIVYLLVEIRKLLEIGNESDRFGTLKFCCDWIAHPLLTGQMAQQIVQQFDKVYQQTELIQNGADGQKVEIDWAFLTSFEDILRFTTFRQQLTSYLQSQGLDPSAVTSDLSWPVFLAHFARIIEDCPLRLRAASLEHVNEVVLRVVDVRPDYEAKRVGYKVAIEWSSMSTKTGAELKQQRFY